MWTARERGECHALALHVTHQRRAGQRFDWDTGLEAIGYWQAWGAVTKAVGYAVTVDLVLPSRLLGRLYGIPDRNSDTSSPCTNVLESHIRGQVPVAVLEYSRTDAMSRHMPAITSRHTTQHVPMTSSDILLAVAPEQCHMQALDRNKRKQRTSCVLT
jgi:hypothetical protein